MQRRLSLIAAASLAVLTSACATVGPEFAAPAPPTAAGYAMAGDARPAGITVTGEKIAIDWNGVFGSPELHDTVRLAVAGNHSLEAARANLARANNAVGAQTPALTAQARASVNAQRINFAAFGLSEFPGASGPVESPTVALYSFGADAAYDFDLFGQRRRETESLLAEAEALKYQLDAAQLTVAAQVVGHAAEIAALKAEIEALEQVAGSDRENLRLARKAFELGGGTRLDVATVEAELANDEAQATPLRRQLAAERHALALLVGAAPADWTAPDFTLASIGQPRSIPVALPSQLVRGRPDIRAAEARLHAATARIGVAEADLYPKVSLTAAIAQSALRPEKLFGYGSTGWSIAPGISVPIFGRDQLKARTRMAEDTARAALADYQQTVLQAFVQVADAMDALARADEALAQQQRAAAASAEALRLVRLRYQDGRTGLLPVLDAQRTDARVKVALARVQGDRLKAAAMILYVTATGWPT